MDPEEPWHRYCHGKICYGSKPAAIAAMSRLHDRQAARGLNVYKCPFGSHWHLGHPKKRSPRKKRDTM